MVRADEALHQQLAQRVQAIEAEREAIAEADLAVETLRCALTDFTARYEAALATERRAQARVQMLLGHVRRWLRLLATPEGGRGHAGPSAAAKRALRQCRERELRAWRTHAPSSATATATGALQLGAELDGVAEPTGATADAAPSWHARRSQQHARLKQAFRALARRFHPDMAADERDRARRSSTMARINALYQQGALERLETLAAQADAAALASVAAADATVPVARRLAEAEERLAWFCAVGRSLRQELHALETSATAQLWHALEGGPQGSHFRTHVLAELREDLRNDTQARISDVPRAMRAMEQAVHESNRHRAEAMHLRGRSGAGCKLQPRAPAAALLRPVPFDPHVDQRLARESLEGLQVRRVAPRIVEWARRLEARAEREPAFVRLILLTYVLQLAKGGMPDLETFAQLAERFAACGRRDARATSLAEALLHGDGLIEYAPAAQHTGALRCQLQFRDPALAQVVPQALRSFAVRQLFAEMLRHLGEKLACPAPRCARDVFAVPLFVVRGLENVRACVCPRCGRVLRRYVLAKGDDVQGVLNATYLDFGLVEEFTVALAQASIGLQLLPEERARSTVQDLKLRLCQHLFGRHDIGLAPRDLQLHQDGRRVADTTALGALAHHRLALRFAGYAPMQEAQVLTTLRYRLQVRFAPPPATPQAPRI